MRRKIAVLVFVVVGGAVAARGGALAAPDRTEQAKAEFAAAKKKTLIEGGTRRVYLGIWCRDSGLVPQATHEFVEAVETSENENPWALRVLDLMRRFDDKFWKTVNKHPSKAMLSAYDRKAKAADLEFLKDRLGVAKGAAKKGLVEESYGEFAAVVRATDKPLQFDAQGRVTIEAGVIPEDVSTRMKSEAVTINERPYLRDEFLQRIPDVKEIFEAETDAVRVRTQRNGKEAADLVAITNALIPYLEDDLGGRPTKRIGVFVFADRKTYEAYLVAAKHEEFKAATGMADSGTFTTLVLAEGLGDETVEGVAMHEMSHVFQFGVTRAIMPSWYCEGFAETYGGDGTFQWDGKTLKAGGKMAASRTDPIKTKEGYIPLSDLLMGDALDLINKDKTKAMHFYAESWAFRTYLRGPAGKDVAANFEKWEIMCRGASIGAEAGKPFSRNQSPAADLFKKMVATDLPALEKQFKDWLATQ